MGFLFPSLSEKNSKNTGLKHWLRVAIIILITCLLTWYGKFYKPQPQLTRVNDFAIWIIPHKQGLSALVALPNDDNDSNNVKTGLRIWVSPLDSLLAFERNSSVRYRGKNILVIGDSLNEQLKHDMFSTLDSNGNFYWLGPLNEELMGKDAFAELKFFDGKPQDYFFDLVYEGCKLRFFGSQTALDSVAEEPLSVAVIMFKPENETEPPFKNNGQIQSLIWNGKAEKEIKPSRIALNYANAMALISFNKKKGLSAKRMHLKDWNPEL